jgi:putative ABC transport system permease protein
MGLEAARAELEGILHTVRRGAAKRLLLMGWRQEFTDKARLPLLLFLGAVGFVFVIVCCNIANLMLARSTARGREILIRSSLGASRSRIARQILTECMFLSVLGGFIGFAMAFWGKDLLQFVWSEDLAPVPFIPVDHRVLGFVLLLSIIAGLVFGMAPILATYRMRFSERLNGGSYAGSRPVQQIGRLLVTLEVALALVLLIGAGLLLKSLILLQGTNPGYRPEQILSLTVDLTPARYPVPRRQSEFFQAAVAKISVLPSVESVAASTSIPLGLMTISASGLEIEGSKTEERPLGDRPLYLFAAVSSGYFRILGIPLLRGRVLDENDRESAPAVAVISNAFAHQYFPNQDPLGCRVRTAFPRGEWVTVVGVVGDVHAWGLDGEVRPQLYRSYLQWTVPHMSLLVRSSSDSTRLVHDIRACIASIDPNQPIFDVKSMEERLSRSMLTPRVNLGLLGTFALTAVLLACMGIYGIVSHLVSRRTNEIGIRMALGARSGDVLQMVVSQSMRMCGLGILIGVAGALYVTRYISSLLYQTKPIDLPIFIALALLLVIIAFFASFLPARKAARVDPMKALRYE